MIWFGWVGFYGISTIVGYLMPKSLYIYIFDMCDLVGLGWVGFYDILIIVGYIMPNPLYIYIYIYIWYIWFGWVGLGFMAYQPLLVILYQILFLHIY